MQVLGLGQVVELEVGQQHDVVILVEHALLFGLAVQNVPDPSQMAQLFLQQCILFGFILFGRLVFNELDLLLVLFLVFLCHWED